MLLKIKMLQANTGGEILYNLSEKAPQEVTLKLGYGRWANVREGDRLLWKGPWENMACSRNEKERDRTVTEAKASKKGESSLCYAKEAGLYLQWNGNQGSLLSKGVMWSHLVRQKVLQLAWKRIDTFNKVRETRDKEARETQAGNTNLNKWSLAKSNWRKSKIKQNKYFLSLWCLYSISLVEAVNILGKYTAFFSGY